MSKFEYTVNDPLGIHARPAGMLAKAAKQFPGATITLTKGEKTVKATQLMMVMGLAVKNGDVVTVTVEGDQEAEAFAAVKKFFEENL